ncbi:anthranilate synthase component I family protein [Micromonospora sp. URMC 105]|uniref:anthranilate synthase component I family protein n=1 Tax=Micromonospora sp. URMC 105 TaxID=3423413 RepID=UPI003F1B4553
MTLTSEVPTSSAGDRLLRTELSAGDTVYRHELSGPDIDAITAAALLRGSGRIMLSADGSRLDTPSLLAVGELAVCGRERPDYASADPLAVAVDFLAVLDFAGAVAPEERCWFGCLGYDAVSDFELLSLRGGDVPTYDFFLPEVLVRFDSRGTTVIGRGASASAARRAAERAHQVLRRGGSAQLAMPDFGAGGFVSDVDEYVDAVHRAKEHILAGDVFQVVLSVRYRAPGTTDGLTLYRRLTEFNPSPYHFWYRGEEFEVVGASPEPCVSMTDRMVSIRPLAGTRPRGADAAADRLAEQELVSSDKELAEHRMLVDLARNDLGRVCVPGSVQVPRLMAVERYSHVMHLTSDVVAELRAGLRATDVIRATFPAGTMTGAPKLRAIEIINDLEPVGRELYSGAVGCFGVDHIDLFLVIRAIMLRLGELHLQAGGGIVYDSDPLAERAEAVAKLRAGARASGISLNVGGDTA